MDGTDTAFLARMEALDPDPGITPLRHAAVWSGPAALSAIGTAAPMFVTRSECCPLTGCLNRSQGRGTSLSSFLARSRYIATDA